MPLAVVIAREALLPMLSQPSRLGSLLPWPFTLFESACVCGIGVDHQHPGAVARGRQRHVQRGDAAVLAGAGADHGDHRHARCRGERRISVARISRMALRKLVSGKPARSVGQPIRVRSAIAACRQDSAEGPHHVGFLQACDQRLLDRRDRRPVAAAAVIRLLRWRRRRLRFGAGRLRFAGCRAATGRPRRPRRQRPVAPNMKPIIASRLIAGGKVAPLRHGRLADDARARGVEAFLLLGFARALEEGLIDVAAGVDIALELAQPYRGLAELDALALLRVQRLAQRRFVIAGARQIVLRRLREALDFLTDGAAQIVDLLLDLAQRGMQRAQFAGQLRITLAGLGILRAQIGDGRRLQRLRNGAGVGRGAAAGFDLVVFGLRVERQRARRGEPLVAGGKLLVADQRVLGADEIVLRLVGRKRVLGVAKPLLQFLEAARQVGGRAPRGGGLRLASIPRDRRWKSRWRASPPWPDHTTRPRCRR